MRMMISRTTSEFLMCLRQIGHANKCGRPIQAPCEIKTGQGKSGFLSSLSGVPGYMELLKCLKMLPVCDIDQILIQHLITDFLLAW